ncbi:MAG: hypothetical protein IPM31_13420 [Anaerolineae bacterium]|nr:hypothetical protein [Anaerolineae bacterium]MBL8106158.1 hypothetical protein [Anaerolineales bacterium]MCC7187529.1 hypothetical protein [Anaerolineales bacterium]
MKAQTSLSKIKRLKKRVPNFRREYLQIRRLSLKMPLGTNSLFPRIDLARMALDALIKAKRCAAEG